MKGIRGSTEFEKQFIDVFEQLCRRHHSWKVWQDFVNMSACAIANAVDKRPAVWKLREDSYMETIKSYSKDELNLISELLSITTLALDENPAQDFLGKFYMQLDFGSGWHGQFFTPWHVAELMAKLQLGDEAKDQIASEDYISVCDSCCGAGCMLMAFAKVCKDDMDMSYAMKCFFQKFVNTLFMIMGLLSKEGVFHIKGIVSRFISIVTISCTVTRAGYCSEIFPSFTTTSYMRLQRGNC